MRDDTSTLPLLCVHHSGRHISPLFRKLASRAGEIVSGNVDFTRHMLNLESEGLHGEIPSCNPSIRILHFLQPLQCFMIGLQGKLTA